MATVHFREEEKDFLATKKYYLKILTKMCGQRGCSLHRHAHLLIEEDIKFSRRVEGQKGGYMRFVYKTPAVRSSL